jgi:hypothetical protein
MILSSKLSGKDQNFKCYSSSASKLMKEKKENLIKTESKNRISKQFIDK